jgi:hypothetical protein
MTTPVRVANALAAIGAVALSVLGFASALEGAGPFKTLRFVQVGLVVGVLPAYFFVLWVAAWSTYRAKGSTQGRWRLATFAAIALIAAAGAFFAPLLPSATLAAACLSQALCPEAANPVLWSYLQLITSLPAMPLIVGVVVVLVAANAPYRSAPADEA